MDKVVGTGKATAGRPRKPAEGSADQPDAASAARSEVADLRLMLPVLVCWATVAGLLAVPTRVAALIAAAAGLAAAGLFAMPILSGRRRVRAARSGSGPGPSSIHAHHPGRWGLTGAGVGWRLGLLTLVCLTLSTGVLAAQLAIREAGPIRELAQERATATLEGTVASDPRMVSASRGRPESEPLVVVTVDVDAVTARGFRSAVRSRVLVLGDTRWLTARWQQRIEIAGRLGPTADPGDDVVAVVNPRAPPREIQEPGVLARMAETVRERFRAATDGLPPDAAGLMPGLVIGDTSRTPAELDEAMRATGMTHLSAVSGSNVAIVVAAALGLCRLLGLRRRWRPVVALALLGAFVVLVRPEPSVVRAAAMGVVGLLGMSVSRRRAGIPALAAAVLVLLCWDPWLARSFGFALSTLATLGLLMFANPWGEVIGRFLPARIRSWGPALAIPVAAQVMCAPVIVLLQGSVTVIGILANLLAAPLVAPATVLGVATALLSVVWVEGASWLAWLGAVPTLGIAWVARSCAALPYGAVPWPQGAGGALLLAGLSVGGLLCGPWLLYHGRRRPVAVVAVGLLSTAMAVPTRMVTWPLAGWRFVACDVGQGDALVLSTGPGRAVVVDVGPDPDLVDDCLRRLGVEVIDSVVLTHFHADHVDGLPGALRGRQVREILVTPVHEPAFQWQEVHDWAAAAEVPMSGLYAGDDLTWTGVTAHVWWPARVIHSGSVPNNASVVLTVRAGDLTLALLGDVEREAAHQVALSLERAADAQQPTTQSQAAAVPLTGPVDVVKVAHHGSSNRDDEVLRDLQAPVAVISVGADNDYGHPAPSTVHELQTEGARVLRTDLDGDVAVAKADDGTVLVATERSG